MRSTASATDALRTAAVSASAVEFAARQPWRIWSRLECWSAFARDTLSHSRSAAAAPGTLHRLLAGDVDRAAEPRERRQTLVDRCSSTENEMPMIYSGGRGAVVQHPALLALSNQCICIVSLRLHRSEVIIQRSDAGAVIVVQLLGLAECLGGQIRRVDACPALREPLAVLPITSLGERPQGERNVLDHMTDPVRDYRPGALRPLASPAGLSGVPPPRAHGQLRAAARHAPAPAATSSPAADAACTEKTPKACANCRRHQVVHAVARTMQF